MKCFFLRNSETFYSLIKVYVCLCVENWKCMNQVLNFKKRKLYLSHILAVRTNYCNKCKDLLTMFRFLTVNNKNKNLD